jgi:hypothetical protein
MVVRQGSFGWRSRRAAAREAEFLDGVVDSQLEFIRQLPMHQRDELAEALAILVMLALDHRHYSLGWISRRELRHRTDRALASLDILGQAPTEAIAAPHRADRP